MRDLMLPGELRRAFAEVLLAKQRGKAELEKARAEAASLRLLANTADLLEKHPVLLELRTLQASEAGGLKLVVKKAAHVPAVTGRRARRSPGRPGAR